MASALFDVIKLLEAKHVRFFLERTSPLGLTLIATMVGKRIEITVDEDDIVDVAVFRGNEDVEVGMEAVKKALDDGEG